jgi:hypothetical protein
VVVDVVDPLPGESAARGFAPLRLVLPLLLPLPPVTTMADRELSESGDALLLPSDPDDLLLEARSKLDLFDRSIDKIDDN